MLVTITCATLVLVASGQLHAVAGPKAPALDPARDDRAAPGDRAHVFDWQHERRIQVAPGLRDARIHDREQLADAAGGGIQRGRLELAGGHRLQRLQRGAAHDRGVSVAVLGQDVADFQLHELEQLGVGHVDLVDEHDHVLDADLAREQHVLARLLLRALRAVDEQDRAVHLRRTRDHVLDVVGVAGTIDVRVAPRRGLVLARARR